MAVVATVFILGTTIAILGITSWLISRAVHYVWYRKVSIPLIVARECAQIDREYEVLIRRARGKHGG